MSRFAIILCTVLFTAFMWGITFLAGSGISREFGVAFVFGGMLAFATVACVTDKDDSPPVAALAFLCAAVASAMFLGAFISRDPGNLHFYAGAAIGFGIVFPLTYWANGDDRAKRGNPRQASQRDSKARWRA